MDNTNGYDALMRATLNKLRVMPEASVAPLERASKSSQALNLPNFNVEDQVVELSTRYDKAKKPESKRAVLADAINEYAAARRSPRRVDHKTIEGKYQIACEALEQGTRETARRYDVPKSNVDRWVKQMRELKAKLHI